jgi:hypothetical protein
LQPLGDRWTAEIKGTIGTHESKVGRPGLRSKGPRRVAWPVPWTARVWLPRRCAPSAACLRQLGAEATKARDRPSRSSSAAAS